MPSIAISSFFGNRFVKPYFTCIVSSDTITGRIGIVDNDSVERSNLQRQILHSEETVGLPKVESATQALKRYGRKLFP